MNQTLPTPTIILIEISNILKSYWWMIGIVGAAILFILNSARKTAKGRYFFDKTRLSLPRFGLLAKKIAVARFARTLGSLLENGVSMLPALEIVKNIADNILIANAIEAASKEVGKGQGLGVALGESKIFPDLPIQMILVGEQSGKLETMLNKIADVYEDEVENNIMTMTSLLEPIMILVMAVIVGFIVLSICLPIFEMSELVR
jgi:general secretion pathway protein F